MQINLMTTVTPPPAKAVEAAPAQVPVEIASVTERRIYVWSSPAPYAVVIQESRSFHRHI